MHAGSSVSIVGLQRSGTNYLYNVVAGGFGENVIRSDFWKHALPSEISPDLLHSVAILLIVRHPALWLESCLASLPDDLAETRFNVTAQLNEVAAYADIYNRFNRDWIDFLSRHRGVRVRYEDLLEGDPGPLREIGALVSRSGALAEQLRRDFRHAPNSLGFSAEDRRRNINFECGLPKETIDAFWRALDPELLDDIGYDRRRLRPSATTNIRVDAYKLIRQPNSLGDPEYRALKGEARSLFGGSAELLYAIGRREETTGNAREAVQWYREALQACEREMDQFGGRNSVFLTAIYIVESILEVGYLLSEEDITVYKGEYRRYLEDAVKFFRETVEAEERANSPPAVRANNLGSLSFALGRLGRLDESIDCARRAVALAPEAHRRHGQLAAALVADANRLEAAMAAFRRAIELSPDNADYHCGLSEVLARLGRLDEALAEAAESVGGADTPPWRHTRYGGLLAGARRLTEAEQSFSEALRAAPEDARHRVALSDVLMRQGRLDEALDEAAKAVGAANAAPWHYNHHGWLLARTGRLDEAERSLREALRLEPEDARHHFALSDVLGRRGRLDDALTEAAKALAGANVAPWHYNHYGWLLAGAGRLEEAERSLREALRLEPEDARHHFALSDILRRRGRLDEALAAAAAAIGASNAVAWHFVNHGRLLAALGRWREAQASLDRAVELDPDDWRGHFDLSLALARRSLFERSLSSAEAAILAGADEADVFRHCALLLARAGRFAEARIRLRRARAIGPRKLRHDTAATLGVLARRLAFSLGARRSRRRPSAP